MIWADGTLRSPVTGRVLCHAGPHVIAAGEERWPVLDGIPFLRADRRELADAALNAIDAGDPETALVLLLGDQDGWARTPPPDEADRRALLRQRDTVSLRDAMRLLAFGPVATYFEHRWSDPTFLSGLALAEAHWQAPQRVCELACGIGHYLREFARAGAAVIGADLVFAKLWLARHFVAPDAALVCFDAGADWPLQTGSADLLFCHDAFYFLPEKPHVAREMLRVANGHVLVGHAHNRLVDNLSAGAPLAPEEYAALFGADALYDDAALTAALVAGNAPRAASAGDLAQAAAVALSVGCGTAQPVRAGLAVPPPGTTLRRNPLYVSADGSWRIDYPSDRYAREYGPLATYPADAVLADRVVAGDAETDALARRRAYVDLPARW